MWLNMLLSFYNTIMSWSKRINDLEREKSLTKMVTIQTPRELFILIFPHLNGSCTVLHAFYLWGYFLIWICSSYNCVLYVSHAWYWYNAVYFRTINRIRYKKTLFEFGFWITINTSSQELFTEYTYIVAQDT